jgi:dolichyl-phosphate beta-glucosyltransferase
MTDKPDFSVVIPAYNEAQRIGRTIESVCKCMKARGIDYEVIVVDDGSTDSTRSLTESYAQDNGSIRLISYHPNKGKGYAVRMGMLSANSENVLLTDADLATPIEELPKLERACEEGYEVSVGSRALSDSLIQGWRPWYRELSGKVFNKVVRLLAVPNIHDTQCGFKLFAKGSARKIFSVARLDGFGFDVEALFLARKLGYRIAEVGVLWANSPSTKVSVLKHTLPMFFEVIKVRVNDWIKRYESPPSNG